MRGDEPLFCCTLVGKGKEGKLWIFNNCQKSVRDMTIDHNSYNKLFLT
jgi:hypothetical protein